MKLDREVLSVSGYVSATYDGPECGPEGRHYVDIVVMSDEGEREITLLIEREVLAALALDAVRNVYEHAEDVGEGDA